uniref:Formin-like protein 3 n=1 Tax=Camelus bactrianus TaxID=9837 RepID=A0A9W3FKA5_CAMBA|nr:formin-like protein 3 [Camelus bactrianus]
MAERPQLRETTATETGAQVTQAEPHLPSPLQPFTVPGGGGSCSEPSPPRLGLNFPSPAQLPAPRLQPQAPAGRTRERPPSPIFSFPILPVAGGLEYRAPCFRVRLFLDLHTPTSNCYGHSWQISALE